MRVLDTLRRPLRSLRISVTDRCNLRCAYCMPGDDYVWLYREDLLTFEEIVRLAHIFVDLGVERVRLTGGEPLLRRDLHVLVAMLAGVPRLRDLSLTTNGVLLGDRAEGLREAGLSRVTVSLDTLRPERFREWTRQDDHGLVLAGVEAAARAGFGSLKINTVVVRGFNDDELGDMIAFGRTVGAQVRFIEYMDVGGATGWTPEQVVPCADILGALAEKLGPARPLAREDAAPAERYALPDGTVFGIISSTTAPFCGSCDRSRLTADGVWYRCLYATEGTDLRRLLRAGARNEAIGREAAGAWSVRADRGAEDRLRAISRGALFGPEELRADPHREMHTRGG